MIETVARRADRIMPLGVRGSEILPAAVDLQRGENTMSSATVFAPRREGSPTTRVPRSDVTSCSAPVGAVTSGRLVFASGASDVTIRADLSLRDLYRARFERPMPIVRVWGGSVTIHYHHFPLLDWLRYWRDGPADVTLNGSVPWHLEFRGGVSRLSADLRGLQLYGLDIAGGGASEMMATLPPPAGTVGIRLAEGASSVTIRRPLGVPVRVQARGGVSDLTFDDRHIDVPHAGSAWQSPDYANAIDRYDISIGGGASNLTIATH